jgi:hypothetical protein
MRCERQNISIAGSDAQRPASLDQIDIFVLPLCGLATSAAAALAFRMTKQSAHAGKPLTASSRWFYNLLGLSARIAAH